MSKGNDKQVAVARVYSQAILKIAQSKGETDGLLDELLESGHLLERDPDFASFVASPLIDTEERSGALERMFRGKASDLFVDALQVMNRKGRLGLLPTIAEVYRLKHRELSGQVEIQVTTAVPLSAQLRERLKSGVAEFTGKEPVLIEVVDGSLIGGMVLQIGDQKIDASVTKKIEALRENLQDRAAREIHRYRDDIGDAASTA